MADGPDNTTVNGREVSYLQLSVNAHVEGDDGPTIELSDLKEISYGATKAVGKAGGPGSRFTRRTLGGRKTFTGGLILYRSGLVKLKKQLGDVAEARGLVDEEGVIQWGDVECTIQMTYSYRDSDALQTIEIRQTTFIDESETCTESEAAQEVPVALDPMNIVEKIGGKYYAI
jgi:hypothetical protein